MHMSHLREKKGGQFSFHLRMNLLSPASTLLQLAEYNDNALLKRSCRKVTCLASLVCKKNHILVIIGDSKAK